MAEAVVSFVIKKVDQLLVAEWKLLSGVRRKVGEIRDELDSIRAFLKDADAREDSDEGVKVWVKQVRELAYSVEDILDKFEILLARQPHHQHGFVGFIHKLSHSFKHLKAKHQIAKKIECIKEGVRNVSERSQRYHFNSLEQSSSSSDVARMRWRDPRGDALLIEEAELVGIDKHINELIPWLVDGESRLGVVSVVGSGGLGKTTLVRKLYDRDAVKQHFQHRVWITVSQTPQIEQILTDMLKQLDQPLPEVRDTMNKVVGLQESLKEFLKNKRYVVVFDDLWSDPQAWNAVKNALPDQNCGSRIMVTTRLVNIATSCVESHGHVYNLEPLHHEDALALFCRKALRSGPENTIPPYLKEISENILRRCGGLPLAIVAIGGLLSTKHRTEWQKVYNSLATELESNEKLSDMKKILLLSYNDLPHYLKLCFLYLSVFPEDYSIKCMRVIRLWTAEGFVEERVGSKVEDVAEGYLNELINRNLVQVSEVDVGERVREFRVHDLIRELIVSKFREQNFAVLVDKQSTSRLPEKVRHLSIQSSGENLAENKSFPHLRSLFMFWVEMRPKVDYGFRLLRVLDLEGVAFEMFPSELVNVPLLRYLSLRNTEITEVPNWIGELQNLQTLDLKYTSVSELPIGILKLRHLRHLLVYTYDYKNTYVTVGGFKAPAGVESLVNLQKLSFLEANHSTVGIKELGRLKQLRRLGVINLRKEDGIHLCSSIEKMSDLRSLDISSIGIRGEELLDVQAPLSSLPLLFERLYMTGRLEKLPHWIPSLHSLVKLRLFWSRLRDDPLEALQDLPNLEELKLLYKAYEGEHLCFRGRKFQRLRNLKLYELDGLKLVRVEEGAMLHLQTLEIWYCDSLETVPLGIENLANLKNLILHGMSSKFNWAGFRTGGEDYWKIKHIPVVRIR